jgi:multidrug efflux pump subunit AcrA (membrane-fusion protein)
MKLSPFLVPAGAAVCLLYAAFAIARSQPVEERRDPPVPPAQSDFATQVAAAGLVEPVSETISLAAPVPGIVGEVLVKHGQEVAAGAPLVRLDTRPLERQLAEARAELEVRRSAVAGALAGVDQAHVVVKEAEDLWETVASLQRSRAVSADEVTQRQATLARAKVQLRVLESSVAEAQALVVQAEAACATLEFDIVRSTITAPVAGQVLRLDIHPGEYVDSGATGKDWLVLGDTRTLHVRVEVDEHQAWRVKPGAAARAQVRGQPGISAPLRFVRFEPWVQPKKSLTGDSSERVDTRALQVIYCIEGPDLPVFVGQQMDVFIEAPSQMLAGQ